MQKINVDSIFIQVEIWIMSIDEIIIKFKGKSNFIMYNFMKLVNYRFLAYVLWFAYMFYMKNFMQIMIRNSERC